MRALMLRTGRFLLSAIASGAAWWIMSSGVSAIPGLVLTLSIKLDHPWNWILFTAIVMFGTGFILAIVRPLVLPHLPQRIPTDTERKEREYAVETRVRVHDIVPILHRLQSEVEQNSSFLEGSKDVPSRLSREGEGPWLAVGSSTKIGLTR